MDLGEEGERKGRGVHWKSVHLWGMLQGQERLDKQVEKET